jgi:hypothetical protein
MPVFAAREPLLSSFGFAFAIASRVLGEPPFRRRCDVGALRRRSVLAPRLAPVVELARLLGTPLAGRAPLPEFLRRLRVPAPVFLPAPAELPGVCLDWLPDRFEPSRVSARTLLGLPPEPFSALARLFAGVLVVASRRADFDRGLGARLGGCRAGVALFSPDARSVRSTSPSSDTGRSVTMPPSCP